MSMNLMVEAMGLKIGSSARKLVLLKLADNANDKGECWPSYNHIADQCEMSRRSAMSHIARLENEGYLKRIVRKKSASHNNTNIYILTLKKGGENISLGGENISLGGENISLGGENISLGGGENISPRTSHSFEPVNEPKKNKQKKAAKFSWRDSLIELGADVVDVRDLMLVRKEKKATNTEAAFRRFLNQCEKAECSVQEAVEICAERGWATFQADWDSFQVELASKHGLVVVKNSTRPAHGSSPPLLGEDIDSAWESDL